MPNWCENQLTVNFNETKRESVLDALLSMNKNSEKILDFNRLVAMPMVYNEIPSCGHCNAFNLLKLNPHSKVTKALLQNTLFCVSEEDICELTQLAKQKNWRVISLIKYFRKNKKVAEKFHFKKSLLTKQYLINFKTYGARDWYDWRYKNWGCKWNADTTSLEVNEKSIFCSFYTPWNPPEEWFATLCTRFPNCTFHLEYYEPGCFFAGQYFSNGKGGYCLEVMETDEAIRDFVSKTFGDFFDEE